MDLVGGLKTTCLAVTLGEPLYSELCIVARLRRRGRRQTGID